ncbi:MAG: hypothetical protein L0Z73_02875 [Gammaproteobacteria bacterium]|nr:hypothetical protein [Gammaproteobacteria bacterium]
MKAILSWSVVLLFLISAAPLMSAEEQGSSASGAMKIEQFIEECEKQYPEGKYPDGGERDKHIDKCIDEKSAAQSSSDAPE